MRKKVLDIWDMLEPPTIRVEEYKNETMPFKDDKWIDCSDLTIQEVARLLPYQLSFIFEMLHEFPNLLPVNKHSPGRIQELVYTDIMNNLRSRLKRDLSLERKITQLWVKNGGVKQQRKR